MHCTRTILPAPSILVAVLLLKACALSIFSAPSVSEPLAIAQAFDDLWDVSQGARVVNASPTIFPAANMLGDNLSSAEPGSTVFSDAAGAGAVHFVEWETVTPVTVGRVHIFAAGTDWPPDYVRAFSKVTIRAKSPGSVDYDLVLVEFMPQLPYAILDTISQAIFAADIPPVTAQRFKAEFVQNTNQVYGSLGPRVLEIDAFSNTEPLPVIISQPVDLQITAGRHARFRVAAEGASLRFQWRKNGAPIQGATSSELTLFQVTEADEGSYTVDVSSGIKVVRSRAATLSVDPAPSIALSSSDLWDVSRGSKIAASSPVIFSAANMFGGNVPSAEPGNTVFADSATAGAVHYVEWETLRSVTIKEIRLFAAGTFWPPDYVRSFTKVSIRARSAGSTNYDVTLMEFTPEIPYELLDPSSGAILVTNINPVTATRFRAEFVQNTNQVFGSLGPRIIELDAFGDPEGDKPVITSQPKSLISPIGRTATFSVSASGTEPMVYQWLFQNFEIQGATSATYVIPNVQAGKAGDYRVVVSNKFGVEFSSPATLSLPADAEAPSVAITSPVSGSTFEDRITLEGTASDNVGLVSMRLQKNGVEPGTPIDLINGRFSVTNLALVRGTNQFKVIAVDAAGNQSSASIAISLEAGRVIYIPELSPVREGATLDVPILMTSRGDVAAMTLSLLYDTNVVAQPFVEWIAPVSGWTQVNTDRGGEVRLAFAMPGIALPEGTQHIATVTLRTRSVPQTLNTSFPLQLLGAYTITGSSISLGSDVRPGSVSISRRKYTGDNNANDRLDVADASVILRFVAGIDPVRSWDISGNDLNANKLIDAGDALRVLRVAVNLDPQPGATNPAPLVGQSIGSLPGSAGLLTVTASKQQLLPGEQVKVYLSLGDLDGPISGASFKLLFPTNALRLEDATSLQIGDMVPPGTLNLWNISPSQNDYSKQDGTVYAAFSSPAPWSTNSGALATFNFTVMSADSGNGEISILVSEVELSDGYEVQSIPSASLKLNVEQPAGPLFTGGRYLPEAKLFVVSIKGSGTRYRVDVSEDLKSWREVGTFPVSAGELQFSDANPTDRKASYYRAIEIP